MSEWDCIVCTYKNSQHASNVCEMCGTENTSLPPAPPSIPQPRRRDGPDHRYAELLPALGAEVAAEIVVSEFPSWRPSAPGQPAAPAPAFTAVAAGDGGEMTVLDISQYSFGGEGNSACTVISLAAVTTLLVMLDEGNRIEAPALSEILNTGVRAAIAIGLPQHLAVDEVWERTPSMKSALAKCGDEPVTVLLTTRNVWSDVFAEVSCCGFCCCGRSCVCEC